VNGMRARCVLILGIMREQMTGDILIKKAGQEIIHTIEHLNAFAYAKEPGEGGDDA